MSGWLNSLNTSLAIRMITIATLPLKVYKIETSFVAIKWEQGQSTYLFLKTNF